LKALLGGSFDPVHEGHLALAEALVDAFGATDVYLIPAARNPLKATTAASAEDRRQMLDLALAARGRPELHRLDWELERPPPSYTIDTLERFAREFPGDRALVLGNEVFARFAEWHRPEAILDLAELWIVGRTADPSEALEAVTTALAPLRLAVRATAPTRFRLGAKGRARWLEPRTPVVSSTELRRTLAQCDRRDQRAVPRHLEPTVWEWIKKRALYAVTEE
jgi:nicotinate-nucleotide adenylyltransferase